MQLEVIEGIATGLSSMGQGGDTQGTIRMHRREKVVQPDGSVVQAPIVSGNGWRGVLRDCGADALWLALGQPELPTSVVHALWSGGALAKAAKPITDHQVRDLRRLVPHVDLFGCAGGGSLIPGRLTVGKLVPCVEETRHLIPAGLTVDAWPSLRSVMQVEDFSRMDSVNVDVEREEDGATAQMRYSTETVAAGVQWWWRITVAAGCSAPTRAWLDVVMDEWIRRGAHLGGRSATGHGRLALNHEFATPIVATADAAAVIEALNWLT